jgi:hypothetical protein
VDCTELRANDVHYLMRTLVEPVRDTAETAHRFALAVAAAKGDREQV